MADPYRIFKDTPGKHKTLKALWPELYVCLSGADAPEPDREHTCALSGCDTATPRRLAVARVSEWGAPACAQHIARTADRPGGWPLNRKRPES